MHNTSPHSITHADIVGQSQYSFMVSVDIYFNSFSNRISDCHYQVTEARTCDITNVPFCTRPFMNFTHFLYASECIYHKLWRLKSINFKGKIELQNEQQNFLGCLYVIHFVPSRTSPLFHQPLMSLSILLASLHPTFLFSNYLQKDQNSKFWHSLEVYE